MERLEDIQAEYFDIRICLIKKTLEPSEFKNSLVVGSDFQSAYELCSGEPLPDHAFDSACLKIIGFDAPFDGFAYNLTLSTLGDEIRVASGVLKEDHDKLFDDIKTQLQNHLHASKSIANAFEKIVSTAWGFDCDADEIEEEALSKLVGVEFVTAFGGSDAVDTADINFAGGIFVEVTPYDVMSASISEDGEIAFSDEIEWEDYRKEYVRFVFALKDK